MLVRLISSTIYTRTEQMKQQIINNRIIIIDTLIMILSCVAFGMIIGMKL